MPFNHLEMHLCPPPPHHQRYKLNNSERALKVDNTKSIPQTKNDHLTFFSRYLVLLIFENLKCIQEESHWDVALNKKKPAYPNYNIQILYLFIIPDMHGEVRGQRTGLSSLLLPSGSWESDSSHQAKQQVVSHLNSPMFTFFKEDSCIWLKDFYYILKF